VENVAMTRNEMLTFVDRWVRAWTTTDLEALLACYDEHAELFSPLFHTVRGIEGIERSHQDLFVAFSDVATDVHEVVIDAEDQRAVLVFTIHATQRGDFLGFPRSGRRTAVTSAFVFHMKDGRIISERRVYDFGGFMMQLGILKTKGV
jgi:steroid delta-isomerase-like uncharacterized protein